MKATFGAGCFWHVEEAFRGIKGVVKTEVGYMGGTMKNPTYEDVCTGKTGHAEVVQIEFDQKIVSYEKLLEVFWTIHDPTQKNRQGPDVGTQYRSAIFYHTENQKEIAEKSLKEAQKKFTKHIVTEIKKAGTFYRAEEYHQKYLMKRGLKTCGI
ncbi:MAG: peptide-methionine (S)-S-oxide reductase MsrA [Candidatus Woesearchaeota archaeon]